MRLVVSFALLALTSPATAEQSAAAAAERPWCASVGMPGNVELPSRTLTEIPDVTDESVRRINLQLSSGCYPEVRSALESRLTARPDDPQLLYVLARYVWIDYGVDAGEQFISEFVAQHPDFVSARVLLAGVYIEQERFEEATAILDGLGVEAEDRLWVYMSRLRIRAAQRPDEEVYELLRQVLEDERFPPNARDEAANTLKRRRFSEPESQIPLYRIPLGYHSGRSFSCKLHDYAFLMTERLSRFAEAVESLEQYVDRDGGCRGMTGATTLLAYAYLVLAADISAGPAPANRAYVERAAELLGDGGYEELASYLVNRPYQALLEPFIAPHLDPAATDEHGRTRICSALMLLDFRAVETELARGADPNGMCGGEPLVVRLASMRPRDNRGAQEHILRLLLQYGGKHENFSYCNPAVVEGCSFYLYPIFQEYGID